jgi:mono/diheme cytochrome c family protein
MLKVDAPKTWTPLVILMFAGVLAAPEFVPAQTKSAADTYRDKCAVCHGEDGAGKTAKGKKLKVKDVRETVKTLTAEQMADGVTKGKDPDMDAFGKELTADQIKQIVAYYRDLATKK